MDRVKLTPLEELSSALRIDEYALNDECREQPTLFYRVSREVAMAVSRRDAAETALKKVEAQLSLDLRDSSRDDGTKITVDEVKARVREDGRYLDASARLAARQEEHGEWMALKEAYQQRSYALNHLVDLYLGNYYGNIERRESSDARTRTAENARTRMSEMRREAAGRD
jgi:hypothetical protein